MIILGIDPGLDKTGIGIIEKMGREIRLVESGLITTSRKNSLKDRLHKIHTGILEIIIKYKPQALALEEIYSHYNHPMTAVLMGHARGVIALAAAESSLKLVGYAPTRVKKAVVGRGNASKEQVRRMVGMHLGLKTLPDSMDITDALALAVTYAFVENKA